MTEADWTVIITGGLLLVICGGIGMIIANRMARRSVEKFHAKILRQGRLDISRRKRKP